jgi:hypothetical protein
MLKVRTNTYANKDMVRLIRTDSHKVAPNNGHSVVVDRENPLSINRCIDEPQQIFLSLTLS